MIPHGHFLCQPCCIDCFINVQELECDEMKMRHDAAAYLLLLINLPAVRERREASEVFYFVEAFALKLFTLDLLVSCSDHLEPLPDEVVSDECFDDNLDVR